MPFHSPGIEPRSPALQADSLPTKPPEKPNFQVCTTVLLASPGHTSQPHVFNFVTGSLYLLTLHFLIACPPAKSTGFEPHGRYILNSSPHLKRKTLNAASYFISHHSHEVIITCICPLRVPSGLLQNYLMRLLTGCYSGLPDLVFGELTHNSRNAQNHPPPQNGKILNQKHSWTPRFQKGPAHP